MDQGSNPGKGVAPSLTSRCSSYWKGSLLVALDYGRQLYLCNLQLVFQNNSVLNFTNKLNSNNKLQFLDALINTNNIFITFPYKKTTYTNSCPLNYKSECPKQYEIAVIKNLHILSNSYPP